MRLRLAALLFLAAAACGELREKALADDDDPPSGDAGDPPSGDDDDDTSTRDAGAHDASAPCTGAGIADDPHNCGACGHDCLGGACAGATCQPIVLATNCKALTDLVVAGTTLYFMESGPSQPEARIRRAGTGCLAGPECAQSFLEVPFGVYLAANNTHLYYGAGGLGEGSVARVPLDGTTPEPFLDVTGIGAMTLNQSTLFVIAQGTGNGDGAIITRDLDAPTGEPGSEPFTYVDQLQSPYDVVVDDEVSLFFSERGPSGTTVEGAVWRADLHTTDQGTVAEGQNEIRGLAVDAEHVYWVNAGNGTLQRVSRDGGDVVELQAGLRRPQAILLSDDRVVWVERGSAPDYLDGRVQTSKLDGTELLTLLDGLGSPVQIAQDSKALYVAVRGTALGQYRDGVVYKLAKP